MELFLKTRPLCEEYFYVKLHFVMEKLMENKKGRRKGIYILPLAFFVVFSLSFLRFDRKICRSLCGKDPSVYFFRSFKKERRFLTAFFVLESGTGLIQDKIDLPHERSGL